MSMATKYYDIVIIGGGMSGLALVNKIIKNGLTSSKTIAIIEARQNYEQDKFWSFWNIKGEDYSPYILHNWDKFILKNDSKEILVDSPYNYLTIDSDLYYSRILEEIREEDNITLFLDCKADTLKQQNNEVALSLSNGENIITSQVFDSRIHRDIEIGKYGLLQHFKGIEIEVSTPKFNPEVVELMNFKVTQEFGLHFMYVLPLSPTRAMIEATWFSKEIVTEEIYDQQISNYIKQLSIDEYTILYEEQGVIPMTTKISPQTGWSNVINIGTRGGITRPSTGYTFLYAQWHAEKILQVLTGENDNLDRIRSRWIDFVDQILLRVLTRYPHLGPSIFVNLFDRNDDTRIIKFLSGTSSVKDDLIIMLKTSHKWAFVSEGIFEIISRLMFWR